LIKNGLKNTLQILIILIFNNFLAQNKLENAPKNSDKATAVSKTDTVKIEKEQIDDIVRSKADNIRNEVPKKMSYLNQNAEVSYQDMKINADYIQIDWDKGLIFAREKVDYIEQTSYEIIIPYSIIFYLKKIENQWYITLVDNVTTDCSR
jgi:hypothetical protein